MLSVPGVVHGDVTVVVFVFPFFHLNFLITKPHLQMSEREKHATGSVALKFDPSGSYKNTTVFAVATLPLLCRQVYDMNTC